MHNTDATDLFGRLMQQEIDCAERIGKVLNEERQALGGRDPEALERVTVAKQTLLKEMEQRVAAHEGFLSARRLPPGKAGTEQFLADLPQDSELPALWQRLQESAAQCRDENRVNGSIVALSRVRVQRALELLHGKPDNAKTYGREGETHASARSQFIGSV